VAIARRDSVLYIPERLLIHRNDSTFVTVRTGPGTTVERAIRTGLSDAINIEVLEGLQATDSVVERPPREIT
jgi:HlyD family secretion protein